MALLDQIDLLLHVHVHNEILPPLAFERLIRRVRQYLYIEYALANYLCDWKYISTWSQSLARLDFVIKLACLSE